MSHDIWSIILIAGLAGWISSVIMLFWRAFPERGVFNSIAGIRWGTAFLISFAVWIAGLLRA
jgi:hypothetical protein